MPLNAASDQGFHCLAEGLSIKILIKLKKNTQHPLNWKLTCSIGKGGKANPLKQKKKSLAYHSLSPFVYLFSVVACAEKTVGRLFT